MIRKRAQVSFFAFPDQCQFVAPPCADVTIDGILNDVRLAPTNHLLEWLVRIIKTLSHFLYHSSSFARFSQYA